MKNTNLSPFDFANIFNVYTDENGLNYYNLYNSIFISDDIDPSLYDQYTIAASDNWYKLAKKYYNDIRLYWIILVANNIINPFDESIEGTTIKILKPFVVSNIISQLSNQ
jgi:hypothetical protein